jgi:hypothetical protein
MSDWTCSPPPELQSVGVAENGLRTAATNGALRILGGCVCSQGLVTRKGEAAAAGEEFTELLVLPGAKGILLATGDCRLLYYEPQVCTTRAFSRL